MIKRLRHTTGEQRKLLLSLGTSFLTRIPGALGVLWFLPLLRFGLGTEDYAKLLTAMALGTAASFISGGFNYVGRRLIGEVYAHDDKAGEADGFASLFVAQIFALVFTFLIIVVYCWSQGAGTDILVAAFLTALIPILGQFDDVRAAYNETYVTWTLLIILQSASYGLAFFVTALSHNIILGALVLVSPYLLTNIIGLVLLLYKRPYLLRGQPIETWLVIRRGTIYAMADGFMMATLSLSVVWLQIYATAPTSAWYATIVRVFQIFLVPIIFLLFPLSSYIRILWHKKTIAQQQAYTKLTLLIGIGYGALVSVALFLISDLYVGWFLHLPAPAHLLHVSPVFLLFGAIVAYKTYSQIAFMVLNEPVHLSSWTTIAIGIGVLLGAAASLTFDPMSAIGIYAFVTGMATIAVLSWNATRSTRSLELAHS